jgi:hypothetical protein
MDLFFPGQLVVELKAVDTLIPIHEAQLLVLPQSKLEERPIRVSIT